MTNTGTLLSILLLGLSAPAQAAEPHARPWLPSATVDTAVFAGGCFWGVEAVFRHLKGVRSATSGYAGGTKPSPSYEEVGSGTTGHAESVRVIYDPAEISYAQLLEVFFRVAHDPTQLNRQGPDRGTQYRSIVFYGSPAQKQAVQTYVATLERSKAFSSPIVTVVEPRGPFYLAEAYHQGYLERHLDQPYIVIYDAPKLDQLKQDYPALYRAQ